MSIKLVIGPLTPEEVNRAVAALATAGINLTGTMPGGAAALGAPPPARPAPAMPPMPAAPAAPATPPPPPAPAAPQASANPRLDNVLKLMDAYSRAGKGVQGARKVLAVLGLARAQDANEEQLIWLEQAFANTAWEP